MVICSASWSGELPVGTKPVVFVVPPDTTTVTTTAATAATTASTPAMMAFRRLPLLRCLDGSGLKAGKGAVGGSDAYHGPDDLPSPESLVTIATVPTGAVTAQTAPVPGSEGRRTRRAQAPAHDRTVWLAPGHDLEAVAGEG